MRAQNSSNWGRILAISLLFLTWGERSSLGSAQGLEKLQDFLEELRSISHRASKMVGQFQQASAQPRKKEREILSSGLPSEYSGPVEDEALAQAGYMQFEKSSDLEEAAPIGERILFNENSPGSKDLFKVFQEDHWVFLPKGSRIKIYKNEKQKKEVWDYPVGTRLIHRFFIKTRPKRLFDIRVIERQPNGRWAYGLYIPQEDSTLALLRKSEEVSFSVSVSSETFQVRVSRLNPQSCRHCHFAHSPNNYTEEDTAGPCDFGPSNPRLVKDWAKAFEAKHGYFPFEVQQER